MLPRDRGLFQRLADVFCGHHGHAGAAHVGKDHLTGLHRSGDGGVVQRTGSVRTADNLASADPLYLGTNVEPGNDYANLRGSLDEAQDAAQAAVGDAAVRGWDAMLQARGAHSALALVHLMRGHADFLPELAFVAEVEGEIVGSILYTCSWVVNELGERVETATFGGYSTSR